MLAAVKEFGRMLKFVPKKYKTAELWTSPGFSDS
jgi:hypothetical protein